MPCCCRRNTPCSMGREPRGQAPSRVRNPHDQQRTNFWIPRSISASFHINKQKDIRCSDADRDRLVIDLLLILDAKGFLGFLNDCGGLNHLGKHVKMLPCAMQGTGKNRGARSAGQRFYYIYIERRQILSKTYRFCRPPQL